MSADWWQNFANNLSADLAPLVSLFGESPTKQYLSETLLFIDIFIFSMAPIGVLTTIVSAIRIAGGPSLRAFIGRAQEGAGVAEAELCSSTSRDVGELFNNGGIARVFGRPKILEIVHNSRWSQHPTSNSQDPDKTLPAGIYTSEQYIRKGEQDTWSENGSKRSGGDIFSDHPNLTLNVGIRKFSKPWFYLAAAIGLALQSGVLVFAALVTYKYPTTFERDGSQIAIPAFPLTCVGTILLCAGVGMCAAIIESSTTERVFQRKKSSDPNSTPNEPRFYWIQPGDQVVGDQFFESFACSDIKDPIQVYTTSWKTKDINRFKRSLLVWIAIIAASLGFVLQFLGLRTLHSTVSVAQFGVMVIMSIIRASLRTKRMKEDANLLGRFKTLCLHHELDWLAIELVNEGSTVQLSWAVSGFHHPPSLPTPDNPQQGGLRERGETQPSGIKDKIFQTYNKRVMLAQMTGVHNPPTTRAVKNTWDDSMVASRMLARKLARAIDGVMDIINNHCRMKDSWKTTCSIPWRVPCRVGDGNGMSGTRGGIFLSLKRIEEKNGLLGPWKADCDQLESVLGLWLWSLTQREMERQSKQTGENKITDTARSITRSSRLISCLHCSDDLELWLGHRSTTLQATQIQIPPKFEHDFEFEPASVWTELDQGLYVPVADEVTLEARDYPNARRLFGSNVVSSYMSQNPATKPSYIIQIPSVSSVEMMCAQELFAIFLNAVVSYIEEIGGNTEIVKGPQKLYVTNTVLSAMVNNFTSSEIGKHDDAVACIVPVLLTAEKLAYSSPFLNSRKLGDEYRHGGRWKEAESTLFPALKLALHGLDESDVDPQLGDTEHIDEMLLCLLSMCELYRGALMENKRTFLFGLNGFVSLYEIFDQFDQFTRYEPFQYRPQVLATYMQVALEMSRNQEDESIVRAVQRLRTLGWSKTPIRNDFQQALDEGDLLSTLYSLQPGIAATLTGRHLSVAAKRGWCSVVKSLKGLGVETQDADNDGLNYLHYAVQGCSASALRDIIGTDDDLLREVDDSGRTPLHLAAAAGKTETVMLLVKRFAADFNARDSFFRSPLDHAVLKDQPDTVVYLFNLEKERDTHQSQTSLQEIGEDVLLQASCCGSVKVIQKFLEHIMASDSMKQLAKLPPHELPTRVLNTLIEFGYNINTQWPGSRTVLSFAAEANMAEGVSLLLSKDANPSIVDDRGRTCLHHAVVSRSEHTLKVLMDSGLNIPYSKDNAGLDPLEYALSDRSSAMASILLRNAIRRRTSVLPGSAIAATKESSPARYCVFYQDTDSQIRSISIDASDTELIPTPSVLPLSAKLFTPLAVVGNSTKSRLFYVSQDNILSEWCCENDEWHAGVLQTLKIKVATESSIAACRVKDDLYVYYQDDQNIIQEIQLDAPLRQCRPTAIVQALEGSDITAVATSSERILYFQNRYFELEEACMPLSSATANAVAKSTVRQKADLQSRTPLAATASSRDVYILRCDKKRAIRVSRRGDSRKESLTLGKAGNSPVRLAVSRFGDHHKLFYQSNLGGIRVMSWRESDLKVTNTLVVESVEMPFISRSH